jgi:hypothetical protein
MPVEITALLSGFAAVGSPHFMAAIDATRGDFESIEDRI